MILDAIKYSYNDLTIVPKEFTSVNSRSECNPYLKDGYLPIFTAPMSSVISEYNYHQFEEKGIYSIIPRNIQIYSRLDLRTDNVWIAVSLKEFEEWFVKAVSTVPCKVCIDIANGHMDKLLDLCEEAKEYNDDIQIMIGNIANPETFRLLTEYNSNKRIIDYVRVSIGTGAGCITSSNTGIHYPVASLIDECNKYKTEHSPKLIADGGIRNYSDVIKALALGADYVMIGSLFAKALESCGQKFFVNYKGLKEPCSISDAEEFYEKGAQLYTEFYGMASAKGQVDLSGCKSKTAEGIVKMLPIEYRLSTWIENMADYLKSAMSYCNSKTLDDFIGKQTLVVNYNANSINK